MITFVSECPCCNKIKASLPPVDFDWSTWTGSATDSNTCLCEIKTISQEAHEELMDRSIEEYGYIWAHLEQASDEDLFRFELELT